MKHEARLLARRGSFRRAVSADQRPWPLHSGFSRLRACTWELLHGRSSLTAPSAGSSVSTIFRSECQWGLLFSTVLAEATAAILTPAVATTKLSSSLPSGGRVLWVWGS